MTQGQTVYVQWYGKVLQGTVVQNTTPDNPLLGCMVAVSIPIQGTMATALFMPEHVYGSVQEAYGEYSKTFQYPKTFPTPGSFRHPDSSISVGETVSNALEIAKHTVRENKQPVYKREQPVYENEQYASESNPSPPLCPTVSPSGDSPAARLQRFKQDHWDHEHNHLNVEALDDFYILWRNTHEGHIQEAAARPAPQPSPRYIVGLDLAADTGPPQPQHSLPVQSAAVSQQPKPQKRIVATQLPLLFE